MSNKELSDFANENNLLFIETRLCTDINVRDVFKMLVQEIYKAKSREGLAAEIKTVES